MKNFEFIVLIMIFCSAALGQQTVEEMMKQMQQQVDQEIKKNEEAVRKFISRDDSLFAEFLKNEFKPFDTQKGEELEETPKPVEIPKVPESDIVFEELPPIDVELPESDIDTRIRPEIVPRKIEIPKEEQYEGIRLAFFGENIEFQYNPQTKIEAQKPIKDESIQKYWDEMSRINTVPMLKQVQEYADLFKLNDYGKFLLLKSASEKLLENDDDRILFIWYMMTKLGFDVRIGYSGSFTALMIPSDNMLYARPFLTINNEKFFIFTYDDKKRSINKFYTYDKNHPTARRKFDFRITDLPLFGDYTHEKELTFTYRGQNYKVAYDYNDEIVKYFDRYPQTDYPIYFQAPVSPNTLRSFVTSFKPILESKSEPEALNLILRFVQTAFDYKTDDEHFGREKPMIPDETLYYRYSDCEDRSILFAKLVEEILGLKVVGLKYTGHMAVGVMTKSNPKGDYVTAGGNKYLVCDPTFINANIGQSMPKFKGKNIQLVLF